VERRVESSAVVSARGTPKSQGVTKRRSMKRPGPVLATKSSVPYGPPHVEA
jgi:hypothetical protein